MTLEEKAKEMFGENYTKECPAKVFKIGCMADNEFPSCGKKSCWDYHKTNLIEYKETPKEIFKQQIIGS